MLEELAKHWEDLGKQQTDGDRMIAEMEDRREGIALDMCEMVTWQQVLDVVRCLRRGKSPGPDGILNEMMVYGGFRLVETLGPTDERGHNRRCMCPQSGGKALLYLCIKVEILKWLAIVGESRWVVVWLKYSLGC